jgi:catechol 2,3-dioxygenase-like lactoylglutathione lyase family enzyme
MRIARVILRVSDLQNAIDFWSVKVGLPVQFETPEFAFLDGGPIQLMLNHLDDAVAKSLTEVVFESDDVRATFEEMRSRGVPFAVELRAVTGDGARDLLASHFTDPDGNLASITGWVEA